jgi:phospholipid/cholesterol/gamma-HCH transport system ATP-binding protein
VKRQSINTMQFNDLSFGFEGGSPVFQNITFALPTARAVWVRSPGGRGKSTFLRILAGLLTPQKGSYPMNGEKVNEMSFEEFLPYRMNIGYSFDMGGLLNNKTLSENLLLPLQYHALVSPEDALERVNEVIQFFGFTQHKDQRPYSVSGSLRKLTCVIRSFIHWPQVVFLDEPLPGLKADNLNDLYHYVEEGFASRGLKQVFFTSERAEFAQKFKAEELLLAGDWFTSRSVA